MELPNILEKQATPPKFKGQNPKNEKIKVNDKKALTFFKD